MLLREVQPVKYHKAIYDNWHAQHTQNITKVVSWRKYHFGDTFKEFVYIHDSNEMDVWRSDQNDIYQQRLAFVNICCSVQNKESRFSLVVLSSPDKRIINRRQLPDSFWWFNLHRSMLPKMTLGSLEVHIVDLAHLTMRFLMCVSRFRGICERYVWFVVSGLHLRMWIGAIFTYTNWSGPNKWTKWLTSVMF